jgi:hypothetical protein
VIASEELLSGEMISAMHPIVVLCRPSEQKWERCNRSQYLTVSEKYPRSSVTNITRLCNNAQCMMPHQWPGIWARSSKTSRCWRGQCLIPLFCWWFCFPFDMDCTWDRLVSVC